MITNIAEKAQTLFHSQEIYTKTLDVPATLLKAVLDLPKETLGNNQREQESAVYILTSWVETLWKGMHFIVPDSAVHFKKDFEKKLLNFITHPDHGITHSFFVYKGTIHLSNHDGRPIKAGTREDSQAQLFALLHDAVQVLPFSETKTGHLSNLNAKNEHARIMAVLSKMYGQKLGFNKQEIDQFAFAIKYHDSSYNDTLYPQQLEYIFKLCHDSDKIFGTSIKTDINTLSEGMLKRNYEANRGPAGSYLFRAELDKPYRNKIQYGDRCLSDSFSLVRKEFFIPMYTDAGNRVAQERRDTAIAQVASVYGYFFDLTREYIAKHVLPNLGNANSYIDMTIVGMEQGENQIQSTLVTTEDFVALLMKLYETPINIKYSDKITSRYNPHLDARGLKIHIKNKLDGKDVYIDPSIARYCFIEQGRELFLSQLTNVFTN